MVDLLGPHFKKVMEISNPMGHGGEAVRFAVVQVATYNQTQSPGRIYFSLQGSRGAIKAITALTPLQAQELAAALIKASKEANQ
jgi:hypothetical protein